MRPGPFGADPDGLASLVLRGEKTGTSSAYDLYQLEGEPLPQPGKYDVLLNGREEAVCILRTTKVYVTPFDAVTAGHARKEGEGDKSLGYWRQVHEAFFTQCLQEAGLAFTPRPGWSARNLRWRSGPNGGPASNGSCPGRIYNRPYRRTRCRFPS